MICNSVPEAFIYYTNKLLFRPYCIVYSTQCKMVIHLRLQHFGGLHFRKMTVEHGVYFKQVRRAAVFILHDCSVAQGVTVMNAVQTPKRSKHVTWLKVKQFKTWTYILFMASSLNLP